MDVRNVRYFGQMNVEKHFCTVIICKKPGYCLEKQCKELLIRWLKFTRWD